MTKPRKSWGERDLNSTKVGPYKPTPEPEPEPCGCNPAIPGASYMGHRICARCGKEISNG